jgi:hypothetical protein
MLKLDSLDVLRRYQTIENGLKIIPAANWMGESSDESRRSYVVSELKSIDEIIERIITYPDKAMRTTLSSLFGIDDVRNMTISARYYPLQRAVQLQKDFMYLMMNVASGRKSYATDVDKKKGEEVIQSAWKSNPSIGKAIIDGKKEDMRLRRSVALTIGYAGACEHNLFKQGINSSKPLINFVNDQVSQGVRVEDIKKDVPEQVEQDHAAFRNTLDAIYYNWAQDCFSRFRDMRGFLRKNEFSRIYTLSDEENLEGLAKD